MPPSQTLFDAEELMHLGLRALQAERDEDALRLLKQACELQPDDPQLLHLLAMTHANIGMTDRAVAGMTRALELAPGMHAARFQFGQMLFGQGRYDAAEAAWKPLSAALPAEEPLRLFAEGLVRAGRRDFAGAAALLERGLAACSDAALAADMQQMLAQIRTRADNAGPPRSAPATAVPEVPDRAKGSSQHVLLSGYRRQAEPD